MFQILVVEDDAKQRLFAVLALQKSGYDVLEAVDGIQGLQMARAHQPDLIVCDVTMPGMDGYGLLKAVRDDENLRNTPVLMLTGRSERADMRIAMTSGADDYIAKPFTIQELTDAAAALIAKHHAQRESFASSMQAEVIEALDDQKQNLAARYERQLMDELNRRWDKGEGANGEVKYDAATVLVIDLFGSVFNRLPSGVDRADAVRRGYQAASDTLYLFGARHLMAYGNDVLAIFIDDPDAVGVSAALRALRAAFALNKSTATVLKNVVESAAAGEEGVHITIALHRGPITLLQVSDPLHGDPAATLATGDTLNAVESLREFAQSSRWRVAASREMLESVADQIKTGATAEVPLGERQAPLHAVELLWVS